jgi:hypothetical protein
MHSLFDCFRYLSLSLNNQNIPLKQHKNSIYINDINTIIYNIKSSISINKYFNFQVNKLKRTSMNDLLKLYPYATAEELILLKNINNKENYKKTINYNWYYPDIIEIKAGSEYYQINILLINLVTGKFYTYINDNNLKQLFGIIVKDYRNHFDILYVQLNDKDHKYLFTFNELNDEIKFLFNMNQYLYKNMFFFKNNNKSNSYNMKSLYNVNVDNNNNDNNVDNDNDTSSYYDSEDSLIS